MHWAVRHLMTMAWRRVPNMFVEDGILRSYSLGVYSARKLGMKTTGNAGGMHNLTIKTRQ